MYTSLAHVCRRKLGGGRQIKWNPKAGMKNDSKLDKAGKSPSRPALPAQYNGLDKTCMLNHPLHKACNILSLHCSFWSFVSFCLFTYAPVQPWLHLQATAGVDKPQCSDTNAESSLLCREEKKRWEETWDIAAQAHQVCVASKNAAALQSFEHYLAIFYMCMWLQHDGFLLTWTWRANANHYLFFCLVESGTGHKCTWQHKQVC